MKVAINGFGRIGRLFFMAAVEKGFYKKIVAINDLGSLDNLAYLLKHDSVHGNFPYRVDVKGNYLIVKNHKILFLNERDATKLPWGKLGIDVLIESSGVFRDRDKAQLHLDAGCKRVLISAPSKNPDVTIVLGVNEKNLKKEHKIISMASCTTNCIAPITKVLCDNFGIDRGFMTTIHAFTAAQNTVDGPHKDFRRGRTASQNIVPTSTGAAKALGEVIPEVKGKLDGYAIRVPVPDGSIVNLSVNLKKKVSIKEINKAFENSSVRDLRGILEYSDEEIVSHDIIHNPHSCIFDSLLTNVVSPDKEGKSDVINVVGWYDNEWGYSNRLVDLLKRM